MTQVCIWIAGTVILTVGVGLIHTGRPVGNPIAAIGSFIALADMIFFGWLVIRRPREASALLRSAVPAE